MNTVCVSEKACGVIYPGEERCELVPVGDVSVPFLLPMGRCVCDDGTGSLWPTAPGMCGRVHVKFPTGIGIYEAQQCTSRTCAEATCTTMASWTPDLTQTQDNVSFQCITEGGDAVALVDDCDVITDQLSPSALCGHVGFTATSTIWTALGDAPVDCELAPSCPESVLETTRLAQSCCYGTLWSLRFDASGEETNESSMGFCPMVSLLEANGSSDASNSSECVVISGAPGWTGYACLDARGHRKAGFTCTATCDKPLCNLPLDGIRPVPSAWLSSEVMASLLIDKGKLASSAASLRSLIRCIMLLFLLGW